MHFGRSPTFAASISGNTSCWRAAQNGHADVCTTLLEATDRSTNVDAVDKGGKTVLHYAAMRGLADVCTALLEAKERFTNVDAEDKRGETALHYAAEKGLADVCAALLEIVQHPDSKGDTILHLAAKVGRLDILKRFTAAPYNFDADRPNNRNTSAVEIAKGKEGDLLDWAVMYGSFLKRQVVSLTRSPCTW